MLTKHFLKTLIVFTLLIALGLGGIFLVSYFDENSTDDTPQNTKVAK
ncbi:MAG: hypothetical protein AAB510_01450 [Patescibacteria group bacterium]